MSYIYKDKRGKYRYVYEVTAYRDGKKTRNKKKPIGRIDKSSGLVIYKEEYLDRLRNCGKITWHFLGFNSVFPVGSNNIVPLRMKLEYP